MGELWRDLVDTLGRRPLLWLPVLVADLLGYLINLGRAGLIQLIVLHQTAQHSALGGGVIHGPMSASAVQSAEVMALLLSWVSYFLRALLYSLALLAIAALIEAYRERRPHPFANVGPTLAQRWSGALDLALRALAVYAVAALLVSWLTPALNKHGYAALLRNAWFAFLITLVVLLVLSAVLPPVALRVLSGSLPDRVLSRAAQQFAFTLAAVAALLAAFVNTNSRQLAQAPAGARYPLEIVGSLVVALPYVLLFAGLSLLARKVRSTAEAPEVS